MKVILTGIDFAQLKGAILSHKKLSFDYMKKGVPEFRTIRPCKLVFRAQAWYLYGFCEKRQDFRYFKLHRMAHLIVLEESLDPLDSAKRRTKTLSCKGACLCCENSGTEMYGISYI